MNQVVDALLCKELRFGFSGFIYIIVTQTLARSGSVSDISEYWTTGIEKRKSCECGTSFMAGKISELCVCILVHSFKICQTKVKISDAIGRVRSVHQKVERPSFYFTSKPLSNSWSTWFTHMRCPGFVLIFKFSTEVCIICIRSQDFYYFLVN